MADDRAYSAMPWHALPHPIGDTRKETSKMNIIAEATVYQVARRGIIWKILGMIWPGLSIKWIHEELEDW